MILAHELAHVRRHDYLVNVLQTIIETVFFFHPAVWWLSHRIRTERENCCDDAAIGATGNRVAYARALLALADLRGASPSLALGANGTSLFDRVNRLVSADAARTSSSAGGLIGGTLLAMVTVAGLWVVATADEHPPDRWGAEASGLVCRLVPVETSVEGESVDMSRVAAEFVRPEEVAFAVELKNVGDESVSLLGVRHGEGYSSPTKGRLNTNFFGPHLFAFDFTDSDGRPIPRAAREFRSAYVMLRGASTHELQPNDSLKILLRPTQFERSMDYRLGRGRFRARVRYRGPSDEVLGQIREISPDSPLLKVWRHEVVSNEVAFSIAPDPNARNPQLVWGAERDGLRAALEIRVPPGTDGAPNERPGVLLKTPLMAMFHVQNVGDHPITFVSESSRQGDDVHVTNAAGDEIEVRSVWFSGWPIDVRWTLQPGDVAHLSVLTPSLNELDQPGEYTVHYTVRFNSRVQKDADGNVVFPARGDWQSELDTGKTPLFLRQKPLEISASGEIHGRLLEADTGKPIRRATVACGAVINDSRRGGGATSVTDSMGNYRLRPPSPGIYTVWMKKHPRSSRATAPADDGVLVEAGKVSTSQLRVASGRYVAGRVIDEDGDPVEHIVVSCYSAARPHSSSTQSIRAKTDGSFAFYVPPGRAYVYTAETVKQTEENPLGIGRGADVVLEVPESGHPEPLTLRLERKLAKFGSDAWLRRSTPGTEIVSHASGDDVRGTVTDTDGTPIVGARVFKVDGPIEQTNERGEFRVTIEQGTQLVMHAFHPGFHVWFGTPTAGDFLKVVLEKKRTAK